MDRRELLKAVLGAGLAASVPGLAAGRRAPPLEPMLERAIPSSGERLPVIGLGTWQTFDVGDGAAERAPVREVLARFHALGGRVVDISPMYGRAEQVVGDLAHDLDLRESLFFATKVWTSGRDEGIRQMQRSLKRLGVERIDLMQVHNLIDAETHLLTLKDWKSDRRVRHVGVTHYQDTALVRVERLIRNQQLDFVQVNYSIADRAAEERVLPAAAERDTAVLVNQPFGGGELFERVRDKPLPEWAAQIQCATWAQFFLKFILGHPAVTCVIPATAKLPHLEDNMAAGRGTLPDEAMRKRMAEHFAGL